MPNERITDKDHTYTRPSRPRERRHRLPAECYRGRQRVAFTICGAIDCMNLADKSVFSHLRAWLADSWAKHDADIVALTAMSDHVHALLEGCTDDADVLSAAKLFKQRCGFRSKKRFPHLRLQKDFYNHILRDEEDFPKHVYYLLNNPVRAGLATGWDEYPYSFVRDDLRDQLTHG